MKEEKKVTNNNLSQSSLEITSSKTELIPENKMSFHKYIINSESCKFLKKKFFEYIYNDTNNLCKLLYTKYFLPDIYEDINTKSSKILSSNLDMRNQIKLKIKNNIIYPSNEMIKNILPDFKAEEENIEEYELETKSREYLKTFIFVSKFSWSNILLTSIFFSILGLSCIAFNYHKKHKRLSNRMFFVLGFQILLNTTSLYFSLRTNSDENFLENYYSKNIEKFKIIYR